MNWQAALVIVGAAWGLQALFTYRQVRHIRQTAGVIQRSHRSGYLGSGSVRRALAPGAIVILVSDEHGRIVEGHKLIGSTSFARFENYSDLIGLDVEAAAARLEEKGGRRNSALREAASMALNNLRAEMDRAAAEAMRANDHSEVVEEA